MVFDIGDRKNLTGALQIHQLTLSHKKRRKKGEVISGEPKFTGKK